MQHAPDLTAYPGAPPAEAEGTTRGDVVQELGGYTILRTPTRQVFSAEALPVYGDDAGYAIATGRVWVRLREGTDFHARRPELAAFGFELHTVPGYAPHAGWVVANGGVADALSRWTSLRDLPDCEHVEPEILREAARR